MYRRGQFRHLKPCRLEVPSSQIMVALLGSAGAMMTSFKHTPLATLALLAGVTAASADNAAGVSAYLSGDYQTAREEFLAAAEEGSAEAELNLAFFYYNGRGVERDLAEAVRWFERAAEDGNATAQYMLAGAYLKGVTVEADVRTALHWYDAAASQGHEGAREIAAKIRSTPGGPADLPPPPSPVAPE
jgi:TPR repeat protein